MENKLKKRKHKLDSISQTDRMNKREKKEIIIRITFFSSTSTIVKETKCQFKGRIPLYVAVFFFVIVIIAFMTMLRLVICCDESRRETISPKKSTRLQ